jgi:alpha-glucosidase
MQSLVQSTRQAPSDTLYLHIYNGTEKNSFMYYEDDGNSLAYKQSGYYRREMLFDPIGKKISLAPSEGSFASHFKFIELIFHGFGNSVKEIGTSGRKLESRTTSTVLFDPLTDLEDYYDKNYFQSLRKAEKITATRSVTIANTADAIDLNY